MSERRVPVAWEAAAEAAPGLTRIAGRVWSRSAVWAVGTSARSARNLARLATDPAASGELVRELAADIAGATRAVGGIATAVSQGVPLTTAVYEATASLGSEREVAQPPAELEQSLRQRGEELLRKSRDVWNDDDEHPAYARILGELAPDEARILMLLYREGAQPSVDVRGGGIVGMAGTTLVATGISMIGPRAGLRQLGALPAYLNNLVRLGLVEHSHEQVENLSEYQVVEAQPDVLDALHSTRFARPVRRSFHLTPFGLNFCTACLVDA